MKRLYFCLIFMISIVGSAQDPTFSQFYANKLYLAPSFAGATDDYRFISGYRNQWPAISNIFNTYSVSLDKALPKYNSGIGILATYDVAGSGNLSTTNVGILYSYDININNKWHIRPGINFKFYYLGLDINRLIFNSGVNNNIAPIGIAFDNIADVDFATSVIAYNDRIWGGITLDHLLKPKTSFYQGQTTIPIKTNLFGGIQLIKKYRLIEKTPNVLSLALNFQTQGDFYQTDIGVYYLFDPLIFGVWYRGIPFVTSQPGDAIATLVGVKTKNIYIGYSYDITISELERTTSGAHELSFIYEFGVLINKRGRERFRSIPCPEF